MKLTFYLLCYLCTFALSEKIDQEEFVSSERTRHLETIEPLNASNPRDKRALGLILSGLAQVFGYTVNPVQIATLNNLNSTRDASETSPNGAQGSDTTQSSNSSSIVTPRQRETIKFTGVLNFGNGSNVLNHLQEYEQIFHGGNGTLATTSSSISPPTLDERTRNSDQRLVPPLLLRIPLPAIPQPPLPEIPSQDIKLSYPEPYIAIRQKQEMANGKNESSEKTNVQNKQMKKEKELQSPPSSDAYSSDIDKLRWKEYEYRLAELERKQEEQAERLRQQERYRNREKDVNYSGKETDNNDEDYKGKEDGNYKNHSIEEENSGERFQDRGRTEYSRGQKESEESKEKDRGYKNEDDVYRQYESLPVTSENYTNVQYGEPLPISDDDEQRRPEELRNSYGELLYNRELIDDGFVDYFGKLKPPQADYSSLVAPNSKEEASEASKEEDDFLRRGNEDEDRNNERRREEYDLPARNKYEEYNLEEDNRKDEEKSEEAFDSPMKYFNKVPSDGENQSLFEERGTIEEVDFNEYVPLIVPARYLTAPDELKKSRISMIEDSGKNAVALNAEVTKKASRKESSKPKKEILKAVIGFPERRSPKKLHESEQREYTLQMWPPPFDFVLDSTIQTDVVSARPSNLHRKAERDGDSLQTRAEQVTPVDSTAQRTYYPENIYYQSFEKDLESRAGISKQLPLDKTINEISNQTRSEPEETNSDKSLYRRKDVPDFWERYKYTWNDNHGNLERPSFEVKQSVRSTTPDLVQSKRFEPSKRNRGKIDPVVTNYFTEIHPTENKEKINVKNQRTGNPQTVRQKSESPTSESFKGYNFFDIGKNDYLFRYGRAYQELPRVFTGKKKDNKERDYRYDERSTKFASEPESKSNEKAETRDFANNATVMIASKRERINANGPISYIDYPRYL